MTPTRDGDGVRMPKQILFVQGAGERVHDEWDERLVRSLAQSLGSEYRIAYPRMPDEADPTCSAWKTALRDEASRLADGAILVGHSLGGAFLVELLAEAPLAREPRALFLIAAPYLGDGGWPSEDIPPHADLGARLPEAMPVFVFHGTDDPIVPSSHAKLYAQAIPRAVLCLLRGRDHQLNDDLGEVAEVILRLRSKRDGTPDAHD